MLFGVVQGMRPVQWYKNLLVFLALVFSGNLFNMLAFEQAIIAFLSLCAISSATYLLNDIADKDRDRRNPEKYTRPIASGALSERVAILVVLVLCVIGFGLATQLPIAFLYTVLALFSLSQIYTVWLKHEPYADILVIATNFVLRAVAGAFAIGVWVSPWLVTGVFFLALMLALGKRRGEISAGQQAHRPALQYYSETTTRSLSIVIMSALVISYALFVFFGEHSNLFLTLPVMAYAVFRYEYLTELGSVIARHPHKVFGDRKMVFAMLLWCVLAFFVLYYRFVPK